MINYRIPYWKITSRACCLQCEAPFTVISQYGLPIVTVAQFVRASGFGKSEYTKASHA